MSTTSNAPTSGESRTATPQRIPAASLVRTVAEKGAGQVLDVRTDAEVKSEHLPGACHIPLDQLESRIDEARALGSEIYLLCRSGQRAESARKILSEAGIEHGVVVEGGLTGFCESGGSTVRTKHMSLERQVRIAAGALVVLGAVLGYTVDQGFFGLSAFVGAGLVFAGLTDTCAMGMALAKMPWNRKS